MSVLGKYRKDEERRDDEDKTTDTSPKIDTVPVAVPNKERKSPIMSFSVTTELRSCLKAVRNEKAINLSMWVERTLRNALSEEFPDIAEAHL
ncbi:MAG: hypothetical protein P1Q69_00360 [Candidatus Thorarchaeota archaeon]|nr:hypothetical protein [Candidatus Thorarchaeota archaeon]